VLFYSFLWVAFLALTTKSRAPTFTMSPNSKCPYKVSDLETTSLGYLRSFRRMLSTICIDPGARSRNEPSREYYFRMLVREFPIKAATSPTNLGIWTPRRLVAVLCRGQQRCSHHTTEKERGCAPLYLGAYLLLGTHFPRHMMTM
jgi:hypothetical protein